MTTLTTILTTLALTLSFAFGAPTNNSDPGPGYIGPQVIEQQQELPCQCQLISDDNGSPPYCPCD